MYMDKSYLTFNVKSPCSPHTDGVGCGEVTKVGVELVKYTAGWVNSLATEVTVSVSVAASGGTVSFGILNTLTVVVEVT